VTGLSTDVSVLMISHVGSDLAVGGLHLQSLDLLGGIIDLEVLKDGLGSLFVNVLYFLWLGVNLLLSLSLTGIEIACSLDVRFSSDFVFGEGEGLIELSGTADKTVDFVSG
jgi:hypothetical protein